MDNKYKTFGEMEPYGGKYAKIKEKMKTDQTENVKKLTTSDDAYSPEKMYVVSKGIKGMKRPKVQEETDLTAKKIADEVKGKAYFKKDLPERALREVMRREERKRRKEGRRKGPVVTKQKKVMPEKKLAGGGMAQRGLGRAFMKGGKV